MYAQEWHSRRVVKRLAGIANRKRPLETLEANVATDPLNTSTLSPPPYDPRRPDMIGMPGYGANQLEFKYDLTSSDSETDSGDFYT